MFWFLNISIILLILVQFFKYWNLSKGKLLSVYLLTIVVGIANIILDAIIAFTNPALMGMLFYTILNLWSILMAANGLVRLKREKDARLNSTN